MYCTETKSRTPGCMEMDLQQFIVRLIELGLDVETYEMKKRNDTRSSEDSPISSKIG
jgi:hypothetical protein